MFDVSNEEYPIRLQARDASGKVEDVVHVFGPIDEKDLIEYQRRVFRNETKRNKLKVEGNAAAAALWLWNKTCIRVGNYGMKGLDGKMVDLMTSPDWKAKVWPPHKVTAITSFYEVWKAEDEEELAPASPLDSPSDESSS